MASLHGTCSLACKDKRGCWHSNCKIIRIFTSGKFLIENRAGYIRAVVPANLEFTDEEREKYKDYDLDATEEDLISIEGYQLYLQTNHRSKAYH